MADKTHSLLNIQLDGGRVMVDVDYQSEPRKVTLTVSNPNTAEKTGPEDISHTPLGRIVLDNSDSAIRHRT